MALKLVGISGSLRSASNNTKLIRLVSRVVSEDIHFTIANQLDALPHFNPDLDMANNAKLMAWVDLIRQADGLVISSPEYARGYPGTLKNAFDWLVQTDAHVDKPFMLLNASDRSTVARDSLIVVLETMAGIHMSAASTTVALLGHQHTLAELEDDRAIRARVSESVGIFADSIRARANTETD